MRHCVYSILLLSCALANASVQAEIYRCDGASGEPAFGDLPCRPATTRVVPGPGPSAAPGSGLRAGERAWLKARAGQRAAAAAAADGRRTTATRRQEQARERDYRCRQKRRALEAVKRQLRRGYRPAEGERLRRRRSAYRDYLAAFCS